jgi:hypothetical protein
MIGPSGSGVLRGPAWPSPRLAAGYETYRRMRRDPTIALARALAVAPVVAGKWTVQADADVPQEVRGWVDKQFLTVREPLLETILKHGYVDFGHQGFELIWGLDAGGRQYIVRFKPLLPDITEILIDDHGGLAGLRQKDVDLTGTSAMLVSFGGEGSNLYGEPLLENVREAWNDWRKANEVAARYDRKIAGAYLLLHYPSFGQGIDQNGAKLDNVYLAQRILDKLEAASGVAIGDVPSELAPGQDPNQTAWRLEVQGSAGGQQQGFVDRLRYLDSLKVRGMLMPERAILEGQHGTLADSQSQGDLALLQAELVHHHLTREINRQAVDPVLEANWGPAYRGKVRLEAAPLSDANQGFLRQLVTQVLADPKNFADLFRRADWPAIFDAVGLPQTKASAAVPSGPSTMISAIGQFQRKALEEADGTTWWPSASRDALCSADQPSKAFAVQPEDAYIEGVARDVLRLAGFDADQPRDGRGRWTKGDSSVASTAAKPAKPTASNKPPSLPGVGDRGNSPTRCVDPMGMRNIPAEVLASSKRYLEEQVKDGKMLQGEMDVRMKVLESLASSGGADMGSNLSCQDWANCTILNAYGVTPSGSYSHQADQVTLRRNYPNTTEGTVDTSELQPGDQVHFLNPYYKRGSDDRLENGSNTFVVGYDDNGKVLVYNRNAESEEDQVVTINDYRDWMATWKSVEEKPHSDPPVFPINSVRYLERPPH